MALKINLLNKSYKPIGPRYLPGYTYRTGDRIIHTRMIGKKVLWEIYQIIPHGYRNEGA